MGGVGRQQGKLSIFKERWAQTMPCHGFQPRLGGHVSRGFSSVLTGPTRRPTHSQTHGVCHIIARQLKACQQKEAGLKAFVGGVLLSPCVF